MPPPPLLSQERLAQIEREKEEELERKRVEAAAKREEIQRMEEEAEHRRNMPVDDSKIVEQMFGFLPEGEQPAGDIDQGGRGTHTHTCMHSLIYSPSPPHTCQHTHSLPPHIHVLDLSLPVLEPEENLSDYKFAKFAATYFQGASTHAYIRRPIKQPILALKNEQDKLV